MRRGMTVFLLVVMFMAAAILPTSAARKRSGDITEEEIRMIASLVVLEGRTQSDLGQRAIAQVVYNRMHSGRHGDTVEEVIYRRGSGGYDFTTAERISSTLPTTRAMYNVRAIFEDGERVIPSYVMYFRVSRYHSSMVPYAKIGDHYFSYAASDYAGADDTQVEYPTDEDAYESGDGPQIDEEMPDAPGSDPSGNGSASLGGNPEEKPEEDELEEPDENASDGDERDATLASGTIGAIESM